MFLHDRTALAQYTRPQSHGDVESIQQSARHCRQRFTRQ